MGLNHLGAVFLSISKFLVLQNHIQIFEDYSC